MKIPKKTRSYRLGSEMQKVIGDFLRREVEANFQGVLVTATEVRISDDFRHAGVYVSIHPGEVPEQDIRKAIVSTLPRMKRVVAGKVRVRKLPEFRFFWDDTLDRADRIEQLLNQINNSQSPPDEDDGAVS